MNQFMRWLATVALAAAPLCAGAIDKASFDMLDPAKAERVLMSFQSPLYFPLYQDGGNVIVAIGTKTWFAPGGPYAAATPLFTRPQRAIAYARLISSPARRIGGVRSTNMNRILAAIYARRGTENSTDQGHPEFVVIDGLQDGMPEQPETLFDAQTKPFVYTLNGRRFVPAFVSASDAIAFVAKLKSAGVEGINRVGLDFRSHLKLVQDYIDTDTPVITFGTGEPGDAERFMEVWSRGQQP